MRPFKSAIKTNKASYKENYAEMEKLVLELHQQLKNSQVQGTEASIARARKRGKFLARERIALLLDKDSPFLELMPLAGLTHEGGFGPDPINCISNHVKKTTVYVVPNWHLYWTPQSNSLCPSA